MKKNETKLVIAAVVGGTNIGDAIASYSKLKDTLPKSFALIIIKNFALVTLKPCVEMRMDLSKHSAKQNKQH